MTRLRGVHVHRDVRVARRAGVVQLQLNGRLLLLLRVAGQVGLRV